MGFLSRILGKKDETKDQDHDARPRGEGAGDAAEGDGGGASAAAAKSKRAFSLSTGQVFREHDEGGQQMSKRRRRAEAIEMAKAYAAEIAAKEKEAAEAAAAAAAEVAELPPPLDDLPDSEPLPFFDDLEILDDGPGSEIQAAAEDGANSNRTTRRLAPGASGTPGNEDKNPEGVISPSLRGAAGGLAANATARMVATGRASQSVAIGSRSAASPSLRAAMAGSRVSHKRRVSAAGKMLGALLAAENSISDEQLDKGLARQRETGEPLGQALVALGFCEHNTVGDVLKKQRTITTITLAGCQIDPDLPKILDRDFCLKNRLLPFERFDNTLCLAMSNVLDTVAKNTVRERSNMTVKPFDAEWIDLLAAIEKSFARSPSGKQSVRRTLATTRIESGSVSEALAAAATVGSAESVMRLATHPLPDAPLAALPVAAPFASEVVQWDAADGERRWLATQLADNDLPLLPDMGAAPDSNA